MAPLPLSGTIGATTASNAESVASSSRRSLPEPVSVFPLPSERRTDVAVGKPAERPFRRRKSQPQQQQQQGLSLASPDDEKEGSETRSRSAPLSIEESLVLVQSLRQSRLTHLAALLPYLSTRHRTATKYHPPPRDHPYPGGLDPSSAPHTLLHLGRADVRVGPLVFPRTRFGEARVEGAVSETDGLAILRGEQPGQQTTSPSKATQPSSSSDANLSGRDSGVIAAPTKPEHAAPPTPPITSKSQTAQAAAAPPTISTVRPSPQQQTPLPPAPPAAAPTFVSQATPQTNPQAAPQINPQANPQTQTNPQAAPQINPQANPQTQTNPQAAPQATVAPSSQPIVTRPLQNPTNGVSGSNAAKPLAGPSNPQLPRPASQRPPAPPQIQPGAPSTSQPNPAINDRVVQAISSAASKNPALQKLLHAAANGKATPEELRTLANFIASVSESIEKSVEAAPKKAAAKGKAPPRKSGAAQASPAKTSEKVTKTTEKAAKTPEKAAKTPEKAAKTPEKATKRGSAKAAKAAKAAASLASSSSPLAQRIVPAPAQASVPWYPPIVTLEFRENPSARFILPLWRGSVVERRIVAGERSVRVTMLLPAIGSSVALRAAGEDPTADKAKLKAKKSPTATGEEQSGDKDKQRFGPSKPPSMADLRAPPPAGAETHSVTWTISSCEDGPLSDGIWNVFSRVEGAKTFVDGVEKPTEVEGKAHEGSTASSDNPALSDAAISALISRLHALWQSYDDGLLVPKLRTKPEELSSELADHLTDRFAPRMQVLYSRPIVRLKRGMGGEEDDVEVLRSVQAAAVGRMRAVSKRGRSSGVGGDSDEDEEEVIDGDATGMDESFISAGAGRGAGADGSDAPSKPKRKRHVAKFNEDGTLKLCQACGTNATPMWRRGPAGKSTLCNACGAKWKVGRLVMPDQPPTAPPIPHGKENHAMESEQTQGTAPPLAPDATALQHAAP